MKIWVLIAAVSCVLAGCQRAADNVGSIGGAGKGRYVGVGLYLPGQMWSQLVRPATKADPAAATLADDEQVIVVLDTATSELRQCGNLSGHCIGLNPWAQPLAKELGMPTRLLKHAVELSAERNPGTEIQVTTKPAP